MRLSVEQLDVLERALDRRSDALTRTRTPRANHERAIVEDLLLLVGVERDRHPKPAAVASVTDSCNTVA